jgi:hypothetical protein
MKKYVEVKHKALLTKYAKEATNHVNRAKGCLNSC